MEEEKETKRQTDRQGRRWTDCQTYRGIDEQTDRAGYRKDVMIIRNCGTGQQTIDQAGEQTDRQTENKEEKADY